MEKINDIWFITDGDELCVTKTSFVKASGGGREWSSDLYDEEDQDDVNIEFFAHGLNMHWDVQYHWEEGPNNGRMKLAGLGSEQYDEALKRAQTPPPPGNYNEALRKSQNT